MMRVAPVEEIPTVSALLQTTTGESLPYRQIFDLLQAELPFAEAIIVTSLPRGGLQIVQPRMPEAFTRAYSRDLHSYDRLTWRAIASGHPVRARDIWDQTELGSDRFYNEFVTSHGHTYAAAAPLKAPVLDGYPGAVHLYRRADQGAFNDDELRRVAEFAEQLDDAIARTRAARIGDDCAAEVLPHRPPVKQFIVTADLKSPIPQADPSVLDERLRENLLSNARRRFEHVNGSDASDRVPLPDARGDLWNFRVVTHPSYPALANGPVVFFCLQPACGDWSALRPSDFQADQELARLLPALTFMQEQFHRGPTLVEVAKTVHLSPFHFHRRFTELLGITPKHFLLDCQIQQAKKELLERKKDLVNIATGCGFAHQSHFTSRFKQATGLTPTRWRRLALEASRPANPHDAATN
jgi:AraC-like DNA-binding protein